MDVFRVLNCLVGFQEEGALKFQMNNAFCIFWLKMGKEGQPFPVCMALLCRNREPPLLHSFKTQGRTILSILALELRNLKKPQQRNSISGMNVHISGNLKCLTAQN